MRESYRIEHFGSIGHGDEFDSEFDERAASPDQVAAVWSPEGDVIVATPMAKTAPGSFAMDVSRFPSGHGLGATVNSLRTGKLDLPPLSTETQYLAAIVDYSERTRILALDGERLALTDPELSDWLISAEQGMVLGTDGHPVFESSLEEMACSILRLPNGLVSVTEVPRQNVQNLGAKVRALAGESRSPSIRLRVETPLRCAIRYFLTATSEGRTTLRPGKADEVTAFLLISRNGYSFGLWSVRTGLFTQYAFLAPDEIRRGLPQAPRGAASGSEKGSRAVDEYIRKAFNDLLLQMSPETLERLQLSTYSQVVWGAEPGLVESVIPIAAESSERSGLEFYSLDVPAFEAVASGLLLGSHTFGDLNVIGAENIPPVDLAHDLLDLANTEERARSIEEEARRQTRRNQVVFTVLAAPVIVSAFLLALIAGLFASNLLSALRESRAEAKMLELKPALERRRSYEANLKWYQEFVSEVSQLRRQQPVAIGLLYQLNSHYPLSLDQSFYVSDLKLSPTGELEMKGMARSKDAIASFLKALEFAGGTESGSRLFSNLAYEVQEVVPNSGTGQPGLPAMSGSTLGSSPAAAPGVIVWSIRGNYLPVAGFAPKPVAANQPAAAPAPAPRPAG